MTRSRCPSTSLQSASSSRSRIAPATQTLGGWTTRCTPRPIAGQCELLARPRARSGCFAPFSIMRGIICSCTLVDVEGSGHVLYTVGRMHSSHWHMGNGSAQALFLSFRFASCFGRPIARMYTVVAGKQTSFHLSLRQHVERGAADFAFCDSSCRVLLVGENKVSTAASVKLRPQAAAQPASIITPAASPCCCACQPPSRWSFGPCC
jgi:hypothetical protein